MPKVIDILKPVAILVRAIILVIASGGVIWQCGLNKTDHLTNAANVSHSHSPSAGAGASANSDYDGLSGIEVVRNSTAKEWKWSSLSHSLGHDGMREHITHIVSCVIAKTLFAVSHERIALTASRNEIRPTSEDFDVVLNSVTRCAGRGISVDNLLIRENSDVAVRSFLKEASREIPAKARG